MKYLQEETANIFCEYCHIAIINEPVAIRNGFPYHRYHVPEKTTKPVLNSAQLDTLRKGGQPIKSS